MLAKGDAEILIWTRPTQFSCQIKISLAHVRSGTKRRVAAEAAGANERRAAVGAKVCVFGDGEM